MDDRWHALPKKHCYFVILPDKSCCKILNKYLLLKLRDRKGVISVEVEGDNGIDSLEHLSQHPYGQESGWINYWVN